jgi:spore germination cell wall hydrolase CwlJ-like protein
MAAPVPQASAPKAVAAAAANKLQVPATLGYVIDFSTPLTEQVTTPAAAEAPVATESLPARLEKVLPKSLGALVSQFASASVPDQEHECLAGAVYFETRGEPLEGQLAVAKVILNRANSGRFPKSLCGVVKQKSQFSFVRGGRIPAIPKATDAWKRAVAIATIAKQGLTESLVNNALFFHARYVSPSWRGLTRLATVGNHIFYR